MLKLNKLEVFSVVTQEGSFSAAAERLHMSQPAVSRHIQELESALGIRLFRRQRRGVTLTPGGEILQDYTNKILWLVGEAEGALTDVTQLVVGQVQLAVTPGVSSYLVPDWTRTFSKAHSNLTLSVTTGTTSQVIEQVMTGRCNLGIVEGELEDLQRERLESLVLQQIELVVVVGRSHHWWQERSIQVSDLNGEAFVSRQPDSRTRVFVDDILNPYEVYPRYVAEFDNQEAIKETVMNGLGMTILPTYAVVRERAAGLLRVVPVEGVQLQRQLKLLWDSGRSFSPVTRAFMAHLGQTYPAIDDILPAVTAEIFDNN